MSGNLEKRPEKGLAADIEEKFKEAKKRAKTRAKKAVGMELNPKPDIGPVRGKTTALVLSGGAARGAYEMGVWQALRELGIKIDCVCGTSIGAMNSYIIAQDRFEDAVNMWLKLSTEEVFDFDNIIENKGVTFTGITDLLRKDFPEEDVRNSSIDMGICTVKITEDEKLDLSAVKPLYLWTKDIPQGEMLDYVLASCSCYPIVKPYEIEGEKFLDGGFYDYIPVRMALEKGAERIIAVNLEAVGHVQEEDLEIAEERLTMITPSWELGSFVVFDPANTRRIMRIGYLDTMKALGIFDGRKYAFAKGQVNSRMLVPAERAGCIFDLDPGIIYTKESFMDAISAKIAEHGKEEAKTLKNFELEFDKLVQTSFKWKNIKEAAAATGDHNHERAFLKACRLLADPETSDILKSGCKKILGEDYGAAQWLIKNGLIG